MRALPARLRTAIYASTGHLYPIVAFRFLIRLSDPISPRTTPSPRACVSRTSPVVRFTRRARATDRQRGTRRRFCAASRRGREDKEKEPTASQPQPRAKSPESALNPEVPAGRPATPRRFSCRRFITGGQPSSSALLRRRGHAELHLRKTHRSPRSFRTTSRVPRDSEARARDDPRSAPPEGHPFSSRPPSLQT